MHIFISFTKITSQLLIQIVYFTSDLKSITYILNYYKTNFNEFKNYQRNRYS